MSDETGESTAAAQQLEQSDVRFSMRAVMIASVYVAILLAYAGWITNDSSFEQRLRVTVFWISTLVSTIAWLVLMIMQRRFSERIAGRKRFRLRFATSIWPRFDENIRPWACLLCGVLMSWAMLRTSRQFAMEMPNQPVYAAALSGAFVGIIWAALVAQVWQRFTWITENGVLHRDAFFGWQQFESFHWHSQDPDVVVLIGTESRRAMKVMPEQRDAVEAVLKEKVGASNQL